MLITILLLDSLALNSKARFVLAAFYLRYKFADTGPITVDELASGLSVPAGECADALEVLLKESVLTASVDPARKAGRPKRAFRIRDELVCRLKLARSISKSTSGVLHQKVIEHLISGPHIHAVGPDVVVCRAPVKAVKGAKTTIALLKQAPLISRSNRLLLAMLFGHSDDFGVVSSLSNADICRLTGLDSTSIKQRIRKLLELGFIRRHVPGVASPIFAKKLKSSYVLNLNHRQIAPDGDRIGFAVHESLDELAGDWRYLGGVWFDLARWRSPSASSRPTSSELATPISVLRLFRSAPKHVFERLEFFLSGCVTDLLTRHWEKVGVANLDSALGVRDLISAFFRKPIKDVAGGSLLDEQEIIDFFWLMTVRQAEECKARLSQFEGLSLSGMSLRLMPSDLKQGYACLGVLIEGGGWQVKQNGEMAQTKSLPREAACPVALRQKAGLLTTPRRGRSS
ncbi:winged helix-turn-helix domain-containing protein [Pseudomonas sp. EA_105y_Pfl2_R69]|uniref:winged helix-turn-helix domain-containing protein n=1 Tax=Pseudomonas sp. EA_105y_Pfl2_R69 TaxID=3088683 RepID=UPI0030D759F5